jgi:hypothetical protein
MTRRQSAQPGKSALPKHLTIPEPKPTLISWCDQSDAWRLKGAKLRLIRATRESIALRSIVRQEWIERQCLDLRRVHRALLADAQRAGNDPDAIHHLAVDVAMYYQRLGRLERTVESLLHESQQTPTCTDCSTPIGPGALFSNVAAS